MRKLNARGDTIVEVLLAILVISVILSGAFVSARRSQTTVRQSQERVEALKVAEGQLERLRAVGKSADPSHAIFTSPGSFCMDASNAVTLTSATGTGPLSNEDFTHHDSCKTAPAEGVTYYSAVRRDGNTFIVHTRWHGAGGTGPQEVQLALRIYP